MQNPYEAPKSQPKLEPNFLCEACHEPQYAKPRLTFLGFRKVECPNCESEIVFRLAGVQAVLYLIWGLIGAFGLVVTIVEGVSCATGIGVVMFGLPFAALVINNGISRRGNVVRKGPPAAG